MTKAFVDVADIRFTQEHIYDSFNANSSKAGGVVELVEAILAGEKTPSDLPLIRIAVKRGAYWCVDNRRLFVYKHCRLGSIPVEVHAWKDNREFELKFRNGLPTRSMTGEGRRVGVLQRTEVPFPKSPVMELSLSQVTVFMSTTKQRKHEASIAALRSRLDEALASERVAAAGPSEAVREAESLLGLLAPAAKASKVKRRKATRRRGADPEAPEPGDEGLPEGEAGLATTAPDGCPAKSKRRRKGAAVDAKVARVCVEKSPAAPTVVSTAPGAAHLVVAMAGDGSGDEDYDVEVTAM